MHSSVVGISYEAQATTDRTHPGLSLYPDNPMKRTIQLGFISSFNIAIAFLFQWYVLAQVGPGAQTDALFASMTVPLLVMAVAMGSLSHTLVPLLSGEKDIRLRSDVWSILTLVSGIFLTLTLLLQFSAAWWVPLTVPGFTSAQKLLTIELARIQLIVMLFTIVNGIQIATYHARDKFIWTEISALLSGVLAIGLLAWLLPRFGVLAAAWIAVIRIVLQAILLLPGLPRPTRPDITSDTISRFWRRARPLLFGSAYFKSEPLVDRFLLSSASSGSLSLYYFSQKIYAAATQVINKAISQPLFPRLSRLYKQGDLGAFQRTYRRHLLWVSLISLAGVAGVLIFGKVALELLAGIGNIDEEDIDKMWWILVWLSGLFVGGATGQICSSSFYARGDTRTPTLLTLVTYTLYLPIKVFAFYRWGLMGLALVTSLYYMANLLLQAVLLEKRPTHDKQYAPRT